MATQNICVFGAGVSGLSTAIRIAEAGHTVTVIADHYDRETTSSIAAAFWYPFWTGQEPDHSWYKQEWAERSYAVFQSLSVEPDSGVSEVFLYEYFPASLSDQRIRQTIDAMWWKDFMGSRFVELDQSKILGKSVRSMQFKTGISFPTFVVNMGDYLSYLRNRCDSLGVTFIPQTVFNIDIFTKHFDTVVNCTGLGSKTIVGDDMEGPKHSLRAVEGVVVRIATMGTIRDICLIHTGPYFGKRPLYIVPRAGKESDIILGGTITGERAFNTPDRQAFRPQHLSWSSLPINHWIRQYTKHIIEDCIAFEPALKQMTIRELKVGYRPGRDKVRLEKVPNVIHNYGHAGGGVTLSWGCAEEVVTKLT
jgi:D-amino-acid oxidase